MSSICWLRRDLRRGDLPALHAAHEAAGDSEGSAGPVHVVFVVDPVLWKGAGDNRRGWLAASVRAAAESYEGRLSVRLGDPVEVLPRLARDLGAGSVHVSAETTPYGARRDARVEEALGAVGDGVPLVRTGSPYAVGPGLVRNGSGDAYQVFTPFSRAWRDHGWPPPATAPEDLELAEADSDGRVEPMLDAALRECGVPLPEAGEEAGLRRFRDFVEERLSGYPTDRDRPDRDGTTRISPYLKVGAVHPRTLLAELDQRNAGARALADELGWREFYADVLHHQPRSAWRDLKPQLAGLAYDDPGEAGDLVRAWREGRTGFPIVDAGMRQLRETGWMHNRLRMVTASFFAKDLHLWWPLGARHFLDHLVDGDLASNNHGWQWVAGTGTDAAPYFRVFNPVTQGKRFDPQGDYVRRWVPELRHLAGAAVHEPWKHELGEYPERVVDHDAERRDTLDRYQRAR